MAVHRSPDAAARLTSRGVGTQRSASPAAPVECRRVAVAQMPTKHGEFTAIGYRDGHTGLEHVAMTVGLVAEQEEVPVRVHSECLTGEALGSLRCDCGDQLDESLSYIASRGQGVLVYLRGHEGRGIGLLNKLRAYAAQDLGADTVEANLMLGLPADARSYGVVAPILADLRVRGVELITNSPEKLAALLGEGIRITALRPTTAHIGPHNLDYLRTKRDRLGHRIDLLDAAP
jgi:3,4-dihydroxy 2-butanone 4-phosphate synthase/GTP cyclohydrolase II